MVNPISNLAWDGAQILGKDWRRWLHASAGGRPGLTSPGHLAVSQRSAGANMSVDVAAGAVLIPGTSATFLGPTFAEYESTSNLVIAAADGTNNRNDLVVVEANTDGTDPDLKVLTGVPSGTPTDPTVAANSYVLARVVVPAGASSITDPDITDLRRSTSTPTLGVNQGQLFTGAGGVIVCTSTTRPTANLHEGVVIYETDTDHPFVWTGTAWELLTNVHVDDVIEQDNDSAATAWTSVVDKRNTWTAPCAGYLVTTVTGKTGFNTGNVVASIGIGNNAGNTPAEHADSPGYALGAQFTNVSAIYAEGFASGASMGYQIFRRLNSASGSQYWRLRIMAIYMPERLYKSV